MATLAEMLAARDPVYGAARKKYGIAPNMLVTPPGLMPGAGLRSRLGQTPNLTRQNMVAAGRPPGPFDRAATGGGGLNLAAVRQPSVGRSIEGIAQAGQRPQFIPGMLTAAHEQQIASRPMVIPEKATRAVPTNNSGFTQQQLLENAQQGAAAASRVAARSQGRVVMTPPSTYEGPEGPIAIQGLRGVQPQRINPLQDRFDAYKARLAQTAGERREAITARGMARGAARGERLAARKRMPTLQEQLAARNPAFAAQLANIQGQKDIAGINAGGRKSIAEIEAGWRGESNKTSQLTALASLAAQMAQSDDPATRQKGIALVQQVTPLLGGPEGGVTSGAPTETNVNAIPPDTMSAIGKLPVEQAIEQLKQQGVGKTGIRDYLQKRNKPGLLRGALTGAGNMLFGGPGGQTGLLTTETPAQQRAGANLYTDIFGRWPLVRPRVRQDQLLPLAKQRYEQQQKAKQRAGR